jgi:transposase
MTYRSEIKADIIRLFHVEKWPIGTIAKELKIHHSAVKRIIKTESQGEVKRQKKAGIADEYLDFFKITLDRYPKICASRLFYMAKERGYAGKSSSHVRDIINELRPKKFKEAFLQLKTLPGEQGQMDWADFGRIKVGSTERKLMAFVFTLSYSRAIYFRFFYNCKMPFFQQGFAEAFEFFGGVPKVVLHDNLKSGVVQRIEKHIQYNSDFMEVCQFYRFEPRAVGVRKGNEKGKVERSIRYIRDNFFSGREWKTLEELNVLALDWCLKESFDRKWADGETKTVKEVFIAEKPFLSKLPGSIFPAVEKLSVQIPKIPFAQFETNKYSVPSKYNRHTLEIIATDKKIEIIFETQIVATHERCWEKYKTLENPEHFAEVRLQKKSSVRHAGLAKLVSAEKRAEEFVAELALRGENIGGCVTSLLKMLDTFGQKIFSNAIIEVLESKAVRLVNMHHVLKKHATETPNSLPLTKLVLTDKFKNLSVKNHDLSKYDNMLKGNKNDDSN